MLVVALGDSTTAVDARIFDRRSKGHLKATAIGAVNLVLAAAMIAVSACLRGLR
jgi:hypothetical protein